MSTNVLSEFQRSLFLSEEDKRTGFWMRNDANFPRVVSPLFASFMLPAFERGTRVFSKLNGPIERIVSKLDGGYVYNSMHPSKEEGGEQQMRAYQESMRPLFPKIKEQLDDAVDNILMPFYDQLAAWSSVPLSTAEAKTAVERLQEFYGRAWELHFELVLPGGALQFALEGVYKKLAGDSADPTDLYELLSSVMNKSLETDRELWKLAKQVSANDTLRHAFAQHSADELPVQLPQTAEGRALLAALERVLDVYGYRTAYSHEFIDPTWVEHPQVALSVIASFVEKDLDFEAQFARGVREREAKYAEILDRLPDGELKQTFIRLYGWALDAACLRDDHHFYIDAMLPAKSRLFLLNVGQTLTRRQVLEQPQDIFHLYLDELLAVLEQPEPLQELIAERKEAYRQNALRQMPAHYGTPPEGMKNASFERMFGKFDVTPSEDERSFKGQAASQGEYTGTVRVVRGQEDFGKLKQGEVLVCKTTTPPWTVLFSLAGAVITDAGGVLSHSGIIAREYKIPAVVGTRVATSVLRDGDRVVVDGTGGVVFIAERA